MADLSDTIRSKIPDHILESYPYFTNFVAGYYEWLCKQDNPYYAIRHHLDRLSFEESLDSYVNFMKDEYLNGIPSNVEFNKEFFIKWSKNFALTKGSKQSIKFLFRILFGEQTTEVSNPKDNILRTSDGKWITGQSTMLILYDPSNLTNLQYKTIQQRRQIYNDIYENASAVIQSVSTKYMNKYIATELILTDIKGKFDYNYPVFTDDIANTWMFPSISGINITNGGTNYQQGRRVSLDLLDTFDITDTLDAAGYYDTAITSVLDKSEITVTRNGSSLTNFSYDGRYIRSDELQKGDVIVVTLPTYPGYLVVSAVGSNNSIKSIDVLDQPIVGFNQSVDLKTYIQDYVDNAVNEQFAIADGIKTKYGLNAKIGQNYDLTSYHIDHIWQKDWQGQYELFSTPRTNLSTFSSLVGTGVAAGTTPPTYDNNTTHLGKPCVAATFDGSAVGYAGSRVDNLGVFAVDELGKQYAESVYISLSRPLVGSEQITMYTTGNEGRSNFPIISSGSDAFVTSWIRCEFSYTYSVQAGIDYFVVFPDVLESPLTVYLCNSHVEKSVNQLGVYIPTQATPVTVTDYTDDGVGNITLGQTPEDKAVLAITGQLTYRISPDIGIGLVAKTISGPTYPVPARYQNTDGWLSSNMYLQDSMYYQNYSYVIKTAESLDKYVDVMKSLLHPAGFKMFNILSVTDILKLVITYIDESVKDFNNVDFLILSKYGIGPKMSFYQLAFPSADRTLYKSSYFTKYDPEFFRLPTADGLASELYGEPVYGPQSSQQYPEYHLEDYWLSTKPDYEYQGIKGWMSKGNYIDSYWDYVDKYYAPQDSGAHYYVPGYIE